MAGPIATAAVRVLADVSQFDRDLNNQLQRIADNIENRFSTRVARSVGSAFTRIGVAAVKAGTIITAAFTAAGAAAAGAIVAINAAFAFGPLIAGFGLLAAGLKAQFKVMEKEIEGFKKNITAAFAEISKPLQGPIREAFQGITEVIKAQAGPLRTFFTDAAAGASVLIAKLTELGKSAEFGKFIVAAGQDVRAFFENLAARLPAIIAGFVTLKQAFSDAANVLQAAFGPALSEVDITAQSVADRIRSFAETLATLGPTAAPALNFLRTAFDGLGQVVARVFSQIAVSGPAIFNQLSASAQALLPVVGEIGAALVRFAETVLTQAGPAVTQFGVTLGTNLVAALDTLAPAFATVLTAVANFGTALAPLVPIAADIVAQLAPLAASLLNVLTALAPLAVAFANFASAILPTAIPILQTTAQILEVVAKVISAVLVPILNTLSTSITGKVIGALVGLGASFLLLRTIITPIVAALTLARTAFLTTGVAAAAAGPGLRIFGAALRFALGPIGLIILAIEVLIVAIKGAIVGFQNFGKGIELVKQLFSGDIGIKEFASQIGQLGVDTLKQFTFLDEIVGKFRDSGQQSGEAFNTELDAGIANLGATVPGQLGQVGTDATAAFFAGLAPIPGQTGQFFADAGQQASGSFVAQLASLPQEVQAVARQAVLDANTAFIGLGDSPAIAGAKQKILNQLNIGEGIGVIARNAGQTYGLELGNGIETTVAQNQQAIAQAAFPSGPISNQARAVGVLAAGAMADATGAGVVPAIPNALNNAFQGPIATALPAGTKAGADITAGLQPALNNIPPTIAAPFANPIPGTTQQGQQAGAGINTGVAQGLIPVAGTLEQGLNTAFTTALTNIIPNLTIDVTNMFTQALTAATPTLAPLLQTGLNTAFTTALTAMIPAVAVDLQNLFTAALTVATPALAPLLQTGLNLAFTTALTAMIPALALDLQNMFTSALAVATPTLAPLLQAGLGLAFTTALTALIPALAIDLTNLFTQALATANATLAPLLTTSLNATFTAALTAMIPALAIDLQNLFTQALAIAAPILAPLLQTSLQTAFTQALTLMIPALAVDLQNLFTQAMTTASAGIATQIQTILNTAFTTALTALQTTVTTLFQALWTAAVAATTAGAAQIQAAVQAMVGAVTVTVEQLEVFIPQTFVETWAAALTATQTGTQAIVQAVEQALATIEAMAQRFFDAGALLGQRLADGLRSKVGEVQAAAAELAAAAAAPLPASPAKVGPLSGRGDTFFRGQVIVQRLIRGMLSEIGPLLAAASRIAAGIVQRIPGGTEFIPGVPGLPELRGPGAFTGGRFDPGVTGRILRQSAGQLGPGDITRPATAGTPGRVEIRPGTVVINAPNVTDIEALIELLSERLLSFAQGR